MYNNFKNNYSSRRKEDERRTKIIENFMNEIYKKQGFVFQRVSNKDLQKQGVDIIQNTENGINYIDEKFAINYYNKELHTYSFELSSHNNKDNNGWFTSPNMITTHYILLWFKANDDFSKIFSYEYCIIEKEKLMEYLKTVGYHDTIIDDFNRYWEDTYNYKTDNRFYEKNDRRYLKLKNGIKIVQSLNLIPEQPINIVIPKDVLFSISTHSKKN